MIRIAARMLAAATLSLPVALPMVARAETPAAAANHSLSSKEVYDKALKATCWVVLKQGWGTGWVLDREKRLVITNEHVVRGVDEVDIYFPVKENGKLAREPEHYRKDLKAIKAKVIDRDGICDLALLQLDSIPADAVAPKLAEASADSGEVLRAIGSLPEGSEGLWGSFSGEVRSVTKRASERGPKIMMVETTMPINHGNSGGAVFNEAGELMGVVKAAYFGGEVLSTSLLVDISEVHSYLNKVLPLVEPTSAKDFVTRGERRLVENRLDGAIADFSVAIKKDAKLTIARVRRGVALVKKGNAQAGLDDFNAVLKVSPDDSDALLQRGITLRIQKKFAEAIADFTHIIRLNDKSVDAYNERALAHSDANDQNSALADLNKAIELDGKNMVLLAERATVLTLLNQFDKSINDWVAALKLSPNNSFIINQLGIVLMKKGNFAKAAEAFSQSSRLNRNDPVAHSNLGFALKATGKFADAVKAFSDAIQLAPEGTAQFNVVHTYFGRGVSERELKDFPSAIKDLSKAIQLNGKDGEFWFERGLAYQGNGSADAAKDDFNEAIKLDAKTFGPKVAALTKTSSNQEKVADNEPKNNERQRKVTVPTPPPADEQKIAQTEPKADGVQPKVAEDDPKLDPPTPKVAPKSPIVGKWVFHGNIGHCRVEMVTKFNADGTYERVIRVTDCEGTQKTSDTGTFSLNGKTLTLTRSNKAKSEHKVRLDDQSLAMNFPELGKTLVLARAE